MFEPRRPTLTINTAGVRWIITTKHLTAKYMYKHPMFIHVPILLMCLTQKHSSVDSNWLLLGGAQVLQVANTSFMQKCKYVFLVRLCWHICLHTTQALNLKVFSVGRVTIISLLNMKAMLQARFILPTCARSYPVWQQQFSAPKPPESQCT